jgi:hypothetical protein
MKNFNSTKGISTVLAVIIAAVVAGAGVYLWQNFDLVSKNIAPGTLTPQEPTEVISEKVKEFEEDGDNTSRMYTNTKYNYSFQYPEGTKLLGINGFAPTAEADSMHVSVMPQDVSNPDIIFSIIDGRAYFGFEAVDYPTVGAMISYQGEKFDWELSKFVKDLWTINEQAERANVSAIEKRVINGIEWQGFQTEGSFATGGGGGAILGEPQINYFAKKDGVFYHFYFDADNEYVESIIDSLKLL